LEATLDFLRGPLFRLCFAVMILGLMRSLFLSIFGMITAMRRAGDKVIPYNDLIKKTILWFIPITRLFRARPVYSLVSFVWHIGLILVPLFYSTHVLLFKNSVGFAWPAMNQQLAHNLTILTIVASLFLFIGRIASKESRSISKFADFAWPLFLGIIFLTGHICARGEISSSTYQWFMFIHLVTANVTMFLMPFTKIAHCILFPLNQFISAVAWKFPQGAGDRVAKTLGKKEIPA